MTSDDWLHYVWLPLGVVLVGGLVLAGILAAFSGAVRHKFWKPIGSALSWLSSIRFTTTKGKQAAAKKVADLAIQIEDTKKAHIDALEQAVKRATADGYSQGQLHASMELEAARQAPRPLPVWHIDSLRTDEMWELRNTQEDAVVTDVALECEVEKFLFDGPAAWRGPFGGAVNFEGRRLRKGRAEGVKFTVNYRDELGDPRTGYAWIDKLPPVIASF